MPGLPLINSVGRFKTRVRGRQHRAWPSARPLSHLRMCVIGMPFICSSRTSVCPSGCLRQRPHAPPPPPLHTHTHTHTHTRTRAHTRAHTCARTHTHTHLRACDIALRQDTYRTRSEHWPARSRPVRTRSLPTSSRSDSTLPDTTSAGMSDRVLIIPAGTAAIAANAYARHPSIMEVVFPNTVLAIAQGAFSQCAGMKKLDLAHTKVATIQPFAFYCCTGLGHVNTFPASLASLGSHAFEMCTAITDIDLATAQLTTIGARAFYSCTSLATIKFPARLRAIGQSIPNNNIASLLMAQHCCLCFVIPAR